MSNESDFATTEMDAADASFVKSDAHEVDGLVLEPYTPVMEAAAQAMGLKYPRLTPADDERFEATGVYPGALIDIAIVLWLCSQRDDAPDEKSQKKGTWRSRKDKIRRALTRPIECMEEAVEWAAELRYTDQGEGGKFWQAYNAMTSIIAERHKVASALIGNAGEPPDPK